MDCIITICKWFSVGQISPFLEVEKLQLKSLWCSDVKEKFFLEFQIKYAGFKIISVYTDDILFTINLKSHLPYKN